MYFLVFSIFWKFLYSLACGLFLHVQPLILSSHLLFVWPWSSCSSYIKTLVSPLNTPRESRIISHLKILNFITFVESLLSCKGFTVLLLHWKKKRFIYLWLGWAFVVHGLSLVAVSRGCSSCGLWASHSSGFSSCKTQAVGVWASVVAVWGPVTVAHRLWSTRSVILVHRALLVRGVWIFPGQGWNRDPCVGRRSLNH